MTSDDPIYLSVLGASPGGYVATIRAGQLGLDVTLVDEEALGGTCLKLYPLEGASHRKRSRSFSWRRRGPRNLRRRGGRVGELIAWKDGVVEQLTTGVKRLCKANQITLREGARRLSTITPCVSATTEQPRRCRSNELSSQRVRVRYECRDSTSPTTPYGARVTRSTWKPCPIG